MCTDRALDGEFMVEETIVGGESLVRSELDGCPRAVFDRCGAAQQSEGDDRDESGLAKHN